MGRHFTIPQAESLLPAIEELLREAVDLKAAYTEAEGELRAFAQRVMMAGGTQVDRGRAIDLRSRRDASAARLKEVLEQIQGHGCEVKDLDMGLIDFPTFYRGEEVLLCWKLGEDRISHWHSLTEGFRGRKEIDAEFRATHEGDALT